MTAHVQQLFVTVFQERIIEVLPIWLMKPLKYCRLLEDYQGVCLAAAPCMIIMGNLNDCELSLQQIILACTLGEKHMNNIFTLTCS